MGSGSNPHFLVWSFNSAFESQSRQSFYTFSDPLISPFIFDSQLFACWSRGICPRRSFVSLSPLLIELIAHRVATQLIPSQLDLHNCIYTSVSICICICMCILSWRWIPRPRRLVNLVVRARNLLLARRWDELAVVMNPHCSCHFICLLIAQPLSPAVDGWCGSVPGLKSISISISTRSSGSMSLACGLLVKWNHSSWLPMMTMKCWSFTWIIMPQQPWVLRSLISSDLPGGDSPEIEIFNDRFSSIHRKIV